MSLALLTLGLLSARPAHAQQSQGHYWQISYAQTGSYSDDIRDRPNPGQMTPESYTFPAYTTSFGGGGGGGGDKINGNVTDTVTATLTWVHAAGMDNTSDPPPSKVHLKEYGYAWENSLGSGASMGTADDGLGDPAVSDGNGLESQGVHLSTWDGTSGSINLSPVTMKAINPVSTYQSGYPGGGGGGYPGGSGYGYWDWTGGQCTASYSVVVVDDNRAVTITSFSTSHKGPDGKPAPDVADSDGTWEMTSVYSRHNYHSNTDSGAPADAPFINWIEFTPNFVGSWHFPVSWAWKPSDSGDDWNYGRVSMGFGQIYYWDGEAGGQLTGNQTYHVSYTATDNTDGASATAYAKIALHDEWESKQNANPATTLNQKIYYFDAGGIKAGVENDTSTKFTAPPTWTPTLNASLTLGFKFSPSFGVSWAKVLGIEVNVAGTVGGSVGVSVPGPLLDPGTWTFPRVTVRWITDNYLVDHYAVTGFAATEQQSADDPNSYTANGGWSDPLPIGQYPPT